MPFFFTFPDGKPGVGLLLLRAAVGITAIVEGGACLAKPGNSIPGTWIVGVLAVASGLLLLIGFITKFAGVLVGLSSVGVGLLRVPAVSLNLFDTKLSLIFMIIMAAAIILLGPGAFSLDARLFGRREITIPLSRRPPNS